MVERAPVEYVLANLGTPTEPTAEAVRAFLREFLGDPMVVEWPRWFWIPLLNGVILRKRPAKVAELYQNIWLPEGSPLRVQTEAMVLGMQIMAPDGVLASSAYRYGNPNIESRIQRALERADRVVYSSVFPQRTASSSGTGEKEARRVAEDLGASGRLVVARLDPVDRGYVSALAARVRATLPRFETGEPEHLLVSFHSIPQAVNRKEGARYTSDCELTYQALLDSLGWDPAQASLAFQSVFGPTKWVGPATADRIEQLAESGTKRLLVSTPGFLSGGLESLDEIAREGKEDFIAAGGVELHCAPAPADHPDLLEAFLRIGVEALSGKSAGAVG